MESTCRDNVLNVDERSPSGPSCHPINPLHQRSRKLQLDIPYINVDENESRRHYSTPPIYRTPTLREYLQTQTTVQVYSLGALVPHALELGSKYQRAQRMIGASIVKEPEQSPVSTVCSLFKASRTLKSLCFSTITVCAEERG